MYLFYSGAEPFLQEPFQDGSKYPLQRLVAEGHKVQEVEVPNVALSYTCASSPRRAHGGDKLHVDKLPERVLLAVVPSSMVHPLPQYFYWWLCAVCLLRGHVEVIYEDDARDS